MVSNQSRLSNLICIILVLILLPIAVSAGESYYVDYSNGSDTNPGTISSPFKTIEKARNVVRDITQTGDIYVYLRGGIHKFTTTLAFNETDSGRNGYNIYYAAYPGETPVISGGEDVTTGWTQVPGTNIYKKTDITVDNFRQLYVGGIREQRARSNYAYTGTGFYNLGDGGPEQDGIVMSQGQILTDYANSTDMELVWQVDWRHFRHKVNGFFTDSNGNTVIKLKNPEFAYGYYFVLTSYWYPGYEKPFYLENAYELLDQPGEWYLNRANDTLYYWPREGVTMNTTPIYIPRLEELLKVEGRSTSAKVQNLIFSGLTFSYDNYLRTNITGFASWQSEVISDGTNPGPHGTMTMVKSAVTVNNAQYLIFDGCKFDHIGAVALGMYNGVRNVEIRGCTFHDVSAAGVLMGHHNHDTIEGGEEVCYGNSVHNNVFRKIAQDYWSSPAISAYYVQNTYIGHNDIADTSYSGISLGWGWGEQNNETCDTYTIEFNRVVDFMKNAKDGGGVYVLGPQNGTNTIRYNYIKNQMNIYGGLYPDNGSGPCLIESNVFEYFKPWLYINSLYPDYPTHDIDLLNNYTTTAEKSIDPDPIKDVINILETGTIVIPDANWPPTAQNVINQSGVEAVYYGITPPSPSITNLALNKTATASSQWNSNYAPAKAIDGSIITGWSPAGSDAMPWFQVDMGTASRIALVELVFRQDYDQPATRRNFEIRASNSSSFSTYTVVGEQMFDPLLHQFKYRLSVDDATNYRYIRVVKTKPSEYAFISEFKVYGY